MSDAAIRRARTGDVRAIHRIVSGYVDRGVLLGKQLVTLYEDVQDFLVAELDGQVVGCGALHVMWDDLAEVRTVAVDPDVRGRGVGHALVAELVATARELGVQRVFVLDIRARVLRAARIPGDRGHPGAGRRVRRATPLL